MFSFLITLQLCLLSTILIAINGQPKEYSTETDAFFPLLPGFDEIKSNEGTHEIATGHLYNNVSQSNLLDADVFIRLTKLAHAAGYNMNENIKGSKPPECNSIRGRGKDNSNTSDRTREKNTHNIRHDSLKCWLWDLEISVPDEKVKNGFGTIKIIDMVCTEFQIASISSSYIPSLYNDSIKGASMYATKSYPLVNNEIYSKSNKYSHKSKKTSEKDKHENPILSFSIHNISGKCTGKYKYGIIGGKVRVLVTSSLSKPFHLETTIQSTSVPIKNYTNEGNNNSNNNDKVIRIATHGNVTFCDANLQVPKKDGISFSGSLSANFIEIFAPTIASHVTSTLTSEICSNIQSQIDPKLSEMIQSINKYILKVINDISCISCSNDPRVKVEKKNESFPLITWQEDIPALQSILSRINSFISTHMDKGVIFNILEKLGWRSGLDNHVRSACAVDCGFFFRGINGFVKQFVFSETGGIHINFPANFSIFNITNDLHILLPSYGDVTLKLNYVNLTGLDKLSDFQILHPWGYHGLLSSLDTDEGFDVEGQLDIEVRPVDGGLVQGGILKESFVLHLNVTNVQLRTLLDFEIQRKKFKNLSIGDILDFIHVNKTLSNSTGACVVSSLLSINLLDILPQMKFSTVELFPYVSKNDRHVINGNSNDLYFVKEDHELENGIDEMTNNILQLILNEYNDLVTETVVGIFQGPIRRTINHIINESIRKAASFAKKEKDSKCDDPESLSPIANQVFFEFNSSSLIAQFNSWFGRREKLEKINKFISCVVNFFQDCNKDSTGYLYRYSYGSMDISLNHVKVQQLASISALDVIKPEDDFHIRNKIESCSCQGLNCTHYDNSRFFLSLQARNPTMKFNASLDLLASIAEFGAQVGYMIQYDMNSFQSLKLCKITTQTQTLLLPLYNIGLYDTGVTANVNIDTKISTFSEELQQEYQSVVNNVTGSMSPFLRTSSSVFQNIANTIAKLIIREIKDVRKQDFANNTKKESQKKMLYLNLAFIGLVFALANFLAIALSKNQKRIPAHWIKVFNDQETAVVESHSKPPSNLMFDVSIPNIFRITIPLVVVGTILIFVVSNLSIGASVDIVIHSQDSKLTIPSVFCFSLGKTVKEMYHAGVYTLMILVLLFSGIWPYIKLLSMLFSWVAPQSVFAIRKRGKVLIWLDSLGKYSLVDIFVMVLMMVSFRFNFDVAGLGSLDVFVTPRFGFYSFLIGTVMSLIIGHIVTFLHRRSTTSKHLILLSGPRESIRNHIYACSGKHLQFSYFFNTFWLIITLVSVVLMAIGITVKSFTFEFKGLAGIALGKNRIAEYSIISLGSTIPSSVEYPSNIGIQLIRWVFYFFALIMPFTCIVVISTLFIIPMKLKTQRIFFLIAEICNAWSAIEVFCISIVVSLLELSQFAHFMVGHHCDLINSILERFFDNALQGEDKCFDVVSSIAPRSFYLFIGVTFHSIVTFCSLRIIHSALDERVIRYSEFVQEETLSESTATSFVEALAQSRIRKYLFIECVSPNSVFEKRTVDNLVTS